MRTLAVQSEDAAQLLVDYVNAANVVARYAVEVNNTTLPVLVTPPDNYGNYADALGKAKLHAMSWIDEMVPSFTAIPDAIVNYNGIVQPQLTIIQTNLNALQANPGDGAAKTAISNAIATLDKELAPSLTAITDLDSWISRYSATLAPDATSLSTLCGDIATAEKADQASIDKLKAAVGNLQNLVAARNELATLDIVGNAAFSIFLGIAGVAVGVPFSGPAAIIVGLAVGIGSGAFTAFVPIVSPPDYQESLATIQSEMDGVNTEIGSVNTIVGLLQSTSDLLSKLVAESSSVATSAQEILAFWQQIQSDISTTQSELDSVLKDLSSSGGIPDAIKMLGEAQQSWSDLEDAVKGLSNMTYQVSPTMDLPPIHPPTKSG